MRTSIAVRLRLKPSAMNRNTSTVSCVLKMFGIRGADGQLIRSTKLDDSFDKELRFETEELARKAMKQMKMMMPSNMLQVVELKERCERCDSDNDVVIIHVNDEPKAYFRNCRVELFAKKKPVGRPTIGVTKKVSLTLEESDWNIHQRKLKKLCARLMQSLI